MNALWVAHDRNKDFSWKQSKPELLSLVSNLLFVRKFFPNFNRILFADDHTKKYLYQFNIPSLFNEVNTSVLNKSYKINPKFFWAYSKILAQRATKGPTVIFDLDFRLFQDLSKLGFFNYDVGGFCIESIDKKYYYSKPEDALRGIVIGRDFNWDGYSTNVSCLYIKDDEFKNMYCDYALDYMYQWTSLYKEADYCENYILFAEQYMLSQFINKYNKKVGVLINDIQDGPLPNYCVDLGVTLENSNKYFYHYGNHKKNFVVGSELYNVEVDTIKQYAEYNISDEKGLKILNQIYNLKDDEGCFRKLDETLR